MNARAAVHPIERSRTRSCAARLDTSDLPPLTRAVVERVVHTSADTDAGPATWSATRTPCGRAAPRCSAGAPLVTDVRMVAAGVTARPAMVALDLAGTPEPG